MIKIVVADDEEPYRYLTQKALKAVGYQVICAPDGESAWELIRKENPDMAILDVNMPGINGFDLCRKIRLSKEHKKMPVMMLTVLSDVDQQVEGYELGADDYLPKPFGIEVFVARVKKIESRILKKLK